MLARFEVRNIFNFKDTVVFDFVGDDSNKPQREDIEWNSAGIHKALVLVGPNGTGKTNWCNAIKVLRDLLWLPSANVQDNYHDEKTRITPFALVPVLDKQIDFVLETVSSGFHIRFQLSLGKGAKKSMINGHELGYRIATESFHMKSPDTDQWTCIYQRVKNQVEYFDNELLANKGHIMCHEQLLTFTSIVLNEMNDRPLPKHGEGVEAMIAFQNEIHRLIITDDIEIIGIPNSDHLKDILENEELYYKLMNATHQVAPSITKIGFANKRGEQRLIFVRTVGSVNLENDEISESPGLLRWVNLMAEILYLSQHEGVLVTDNIGLYLDPHLVEALFERIYEDDINMQFITTATSFEGINECVEDDQVRLLIQNPITLSTTIMTVHEFAQSVDKANKLN